MRKLLLALGVAALAAGLSPGAFGLDVPLKYEKPVNNQEMSFPYGYGRAEVAATIPASGWKLPVFTTDKPYNVLLSLGEKQLLIIFDKKKAEDKAYTRLWFDQDGDNDLTDEKPIDGTSQSMGVPNDGSFSVQFPQIEFSVVVDGAKLPYCIQPMLYAYSNGSAGNIQFNFQYSVMCCYTGVFTAGNTKYTMRIGDRNGNARFNDPVKVIDYKLPDRKTPLYVEGDIAYITDGKTAGYYDSQTLGDYLMVNDTLFEVKIDIPKNKMVLNEVKSGLLPVKLTAKPERFSILTEDNKHCLMAFKPTGDAIRLPAGKYRLLSYQMYRKDAQGDLWRLMAGGSNESPVATVASGQTAVLSFGEPFLPVVTLPSTEQMPGASKGSAPLSFSIEGLGKEIINDITHFEGGATQIQLSKTRKERPREPSYTIVKNDGEIVAKGSFEYG